VVLDERKNKQTQEIASLVVGLQKVHVLNSHQVKGKTGRVPIEDFCGRELYLQTFFNSAFERGDYLASSPGQFTIRKKSS
jgi:hypothetical protein